MAIRISNQESQPGYVFVGYLNDTFIQSRILRLYVKKSNQDPFEYYASHDSTPYLRIPLGKFRKFLLDQDKIKVPGYASPFKVNLNEDISDVYDYSICPNC